MRAALLGLLILLSWLPETGAVQPPTAAPTPAPGAQPLLDTETLWQESFDGAAATFEELPASPFLLPAVDPRFHLLRMTCDSSSAEFAPATAIQYPDSIRIWQRQFDLTFSFAMSAGSERFACCLIHERLSAAPASLDSVAGLAVVFERGAEAITATVRVGSETLAEGSLAPASDALQHVRVYFDDLFHLLRVSCLEWGEEWGVVPLTLAFVPTFVWPSFVVCAPGGGRVVLDNVCLAITDNHICPVECAAPTGVELSAAGPGQLRLRIPAAVAPLFPVLSYQVYVGPVPPSADVVDNVVNRGFERIAVLPASPTEPVERLLEVDPEERGFVFVTADCGL